MEGVMASPDMEGVMAKRLSAGRNVCVRGVRGGRNMCVQGKKSVRDDLLVGGLVLFFWVEGMG